MFNMLHEITFTLFFKLWQKKVFLKVLPELVKIFIYNSSHQTSYT